MTVAEKEKLVASKIQENLPGLIFNAIHWGQGEDREQITYYINAELASFRNSNYYYSPCKSLVHFTKFESLKSIIESKTLRLYNLNNLNDPREYSYGSEFVHDKAEDFEDCKENYFVLSFCNESILKESTDREFNMWRLYGDNGLGAAVKLDFVNIDDYCWNDFFLSRVFYGNQEKSKIQNISETIKRSEQYKPLITIDISRISCFHKSNLFSLEKEIRLLYDKRKTRGMGYSKYYMEGEFKFPLEIFDKDKSQKLGKNIKFIELEVHNINHPIISPCIPIPRIREIIFGYNCKEDYSKLKYEFEEICNFNLGYIPKLSLSRLAKYYHE